MLMPALGIGLVVYLAVKVDPRNLVASAKTIGWGILFVIALAGLSHVLKTVAWRLALDGEAHKVPFARTLGLRLVSEAIGQFGFLGTVFGETARVSMIGSGVSTAGGISSVTLDRGLFIITGAAVTIGGILSAVFAVSLPHAFHLYAGIVVLALLSLLMAAGMAVHKGWPLISGTARAAARIPWFRNWLHSKESIIQSAEAQIIRFHRQAPAAFWASVLLNFLTHALAIMEVYLILLLLGTPVSLLGALILESLTKLINVIGAVNPGNLGTYEGGNMVIGSLFRLTASQGLMLGLCRRVRAIFWSIVGAVCLIWFWKSSKKAKFEVNGGDDLSAKTIAAEDATQSPSGSRLALILANEERSYPRFESELARVGTLPVALRAILGVRSTDPDRTIVVINPISGPGIRSGLEKTNRLPGDIEWLEVAVGATLSSIMNLCATGARQIDVIMGDRTYQPALHRIMSEWNGEGGAIELASGDGLVGLFALSRETALDLEADSKSRVVTGLDLHNWIARNAASSGATSGLSRQVPDDLWQVVASEDDRVIAESKLDHWLVKPTDGVFARMNRRVSIPISRQLLKFPISANMMSLFTLGLSFVSGVFFALGGYWNTLAGAALSVLASILDGCDGEIARLKLQVSDFGCWLDSICDYLYYLFVYVGMSIGLARSRGDSSFLGWGAAILVGAITTFIVAGIGRKQLSGDHPEQYLAVWQKKAESRSSNPFFYIARYTEFIIRRCFLPYAFLAFALVNLIQVALYMSAIGANVAWIISLYSHITFSSRCPIVSRAAGSPASDDLVA